MVAGDSKRIVVIKNISSNLIEEAILILKGGPEVLKDSGTDRHDQKKYNTRNDFLLKEAEYIISQYIKEHGLIKNQNKRLPLRGKSRFRISINAVSNILLGAVVILLLVVIINLL